MLKGVETPDNSDCEGAANTDKKEVKREIVGFEWTKSCWKRKDPERLGHNPDTTILNMPEED